MEIQWKMTFKNETTVESQARARHTKLTENRVRNNFLWHCCRFYRSTRHSSIFYILHFFFCENDSGTETQSEEKSQRQSTAPKLSPEWVAGEKQRKFVAEYFHNSKEFGVESTAERKKMLIFPSTSAPCSGRVNGGLGGGEILGGLSVGGNK